MLDLSPIIAVEYADQAKANRIRAWARRNRAIAKLTPYTRGAYAGTVKVCSPWNEGKDETDRRVAALKTLIAS